MIAKVNNQF